MTTATTGKRGTELALPTAAPVPLGPAPLTEQRRPWLAMSLLVLAAGAERAAAHISGHEAELAYGTAAVAFVAAVVVATRGHRMTKHLRRRFLAAVWGAAGWLTYVAAAGLTWGAVATLMAVGSLLSLLYWREHRIEGPTEAQPIEADGDLYADRWRENLAEVDAQLAGSRLTNRETIRSGYRYTLRLIPGKQTIAEVMSKDSKIRSGLQLLPGQDIIIEAHRTLPQPNATLTVITKSTVQNDQPWPGPAHSWDAERGSVKLGPFVDGEGIARWSVYRQDGIFGGFLQGAPGSGKSRMVEAIAMATASSTSHPTIVWFGCGQHGDSSPLLVDLADYVATSAESVLDMLRAALKVMHVNGVQNRRDGLRGFTPAPERPGLLIIVDEFHNFLDEKLCPLANDIQDLMVVIAREGRKVGVGLILATQEPLLAAFGNGKKADLLRSCLLNGNGVMLRSETNNAKMVFKVEVNPREFPNLPGYAWLARPAPGERSAPLRGYYVNDQQIERWAKSFKWRELPPIQAKYAGKPYARRREVVDQQRHEDEALLSMLMDESFLDEELKPFTRSMDAAAQPAAAGGDGASYGDFMTIPATVPKFWEQASYVRPTTGLTKAEQRITAAIAAGHVKPSQIMGATGYSSTYVHATLADLAQREVIERAGYGQYQLVA